MFLHVGLSAGLGRNPDWADSRYGVGDANLYVSHGCVLSLCILYVFVLCSMPSVWSLIGWGGGQGSYDDRSHHSFGGKAYSLVSLSNARWNTDAELINVNLFTLFNSRKPFCFAPCCCVVMSQASSTQFAYLGSLANESSAFRDDLCPGSRTGLHFISQAQLIGCLASWGRSLTLITLPF